MTYLWVPVIGSGAHRDPQRGDVPDGIEYDFALPIQIDPTTGKATVATAPISVADADAAGVTAAVAAPPAADAVAYATALVEFVSIGALTQAQAEALAASLGLALDG
jgi:hypothetical protein